MIDSNEMDIFSSFTLNSLNNCSPLTVKQIIYYQFLLYPYCYHYHFIKPNEWLKEEAFIKEQ